jgi:predicted molibdopterin-dependent oxidoreductase YjgC
MRPSWQVAASRKPLPRGASSCPAPENSPKSAGITGVPAAAIRAAARLYATAGNGAIYYGLGVTEHSQGSTMVMGIANLAMATGNIGRPGVGVNPLRGQNNVQGSCDMGSFPTSCPATAMCPTPPPGPVRSRAWNVSIDPEPGLRIPNMFEAALDGSFKGIYIQGEDIVQSDPNTQHVEAAWRRWNAWWCRTSSSTKPPSGPTCFCRAPVSWRRTAPSPTPSGASRGCAR